MKSARVHRDVRRGGSSRRLVLACGILLFSLPLRLPADALAQLPPAWQNRLQPVPEADLSGAEAVGQESINTDPGAARGTAAGAATDTAELAAGYGNLAALYQLFKINTAAGLCWDNARTLQPEEFRWSYFAGYLALNEGRTDTALARFQRAAALKPDYAPLQLRMGQLRLDTDQLDQAQTALKPPPPRPACAPPHCTTWGRWTCCGATTRAR